MDLTETTLSQTESTSTGLSSISPGSAIVRSGMNDAILERKKSKKRSKHKRRRSKEEASLLTTSNSSSIGGEDLQLEHGRSSHHRRSRRPSDVSNPQSSSPYMDASEETSRRNKKKKKSKSHHKRKSKSRIEAGIVDDEQEEEERETTRETLVIYPDDGISPAIGASRRKSKATSGSSSTSVTAQSTSEMGSAMTRPDDGATSSPSEQQENFRQGNGSDNRELFLQYVLSQGTPQPQAEQMADAFFAMQTQQRQQQSKVASQTRSAAPIMEIPREGRTMPKAPKAFQLTSLEEKLREAEGQYGEEEKEEIGAMDHPVEEAATTEELFAVSSPVPVRSSHSMGVTTGTSPANSRPGSRHSRHSWRSAGDGLPAAVWPRAEEPGAVEMEGRAFGAPVSAHADGGADSWQDDENDIEKDGITLEAQPIEAEPELPTVYAESTPLGIKEFVSSHPRRNLMLVVCCLVIIGTIVGVIFAVSQGVSNADDGVVNSPDTSAPSVAPSAMPSFIDDELLAEAEAVSGELLPGSPQFEAVGWMSTFDRITSSNIVAGFRQRYAFIVFYLSTQGDDWSETADWLNPDKHECEWSDDIECQIDPTGRRFVTTLNLVSNNLNGTIPKEIGLLSEITKMDCSQNLLRGSIPLELFKLNRLRLLDLSSNELSGGIPENIGELENIFEVRLPRNNLTGPLPNALYNLVDMRLLDLSFNQLNGSISDEGLGQLVSLEELHLNNNEFGGTLPRVGGSFEVGIYDWNQFTGSIPGSSLQSQRIFSAAHNRLSGEFPGKQFLNVPEAFLDQVLEIFKGSKIQRIDVSYNELTGSLPNLGLLPSLEELDVSGNLFTGKFPAGDNLQSGRAVSWKLLSRLSAAKNQFTGSIPLEFSPNMKFLDLSANKFEGGVPNVHIVLESLEFLKLSDNDLGGTLPEFDHDHEDEDSHIHQGFNLRGFEVRNCSLMTMNVPADLGLLTKLEILDLGQNDFVGAIPTEGFTPLTLLNRLHYDNNRLSFTIPAQLGNLERLTSLRLENNRLSGRVPPRLQALSRLEHLSFEGNDGLVGAIDEAICALPLLGGLSASHVPCSVQCECCVNQTASACGEGSTASDNVFSR